MAYSREGLAPLKARLADYLAIKCGIENTARPFRCICPEHEDMHPSMCIMPSGNVVKCHACGFSGDVFEVAQKVEGLNFLEAVAAVARTLGQALPKGSVRTAKHMQTRVRYEPPKMPEHPNIIETVQAANLRLFSTEGREGIEYMKRRGFTCDDMMRNGIGFISSPVQLAPNMFQISKEDYARGFLVLPAMNRECTECHYATLRPLKKDPIHKEWNPTGIRPVWHEWALTGDAAGKVLIVTEGVFDAMALEIIAHDFDTKSNELRPRDSWERPYVDYIPVALLSTSGVSRFLSTLYYTANNKRPARVVVSLDSDNAGQSATTKLLDGLCSLGIPCSRMQPFPNSSKDANQWLQQLRGVA